VISEVGRFIARPDQFQEADRRLLRFFARRSVALNGGKEEYEIGDLSDSTVPRCLERHLEAEQPEEDFFAVVLKEIRSLHIAETRWQRLTARFVHPLALERRLTSAGRYLAGLPATTLAKLMPRIRWNDSKGEFIAALITHAPEVLAGVMDELIRHKKISDLPFGGWVAALDNNPTRYESRALGALRLMGDDYPEKSQLAMKLAQFSPGKYRAEAVEAVGAGLGWAQDEIKAVRWLIEQQGAAASEAIADYVAGFQPDNDVLQDAKTGVLRETVKLLGSDSKPVLLAAMQRKMSELSRNALELWKGLADAGDDQKLKQKLLEEISSDESKLLQRFIPVAAGWNVPQLAPRFWQLLQHKSKPVRDAAAQALSKLGDKAVPMAVELLAVRKADTRKAAVLLLAGVATDRARQALRCHLILEPTADVRDTIQKWLAREATKSQTIEGQALPMDAQTHKASMVDQKQVEAAIACAAPKIKGLPAWISESALPAIYFADGKALNQDAVRYVLYRQSREKEIAADTEAALVYAVIDRKRSGDFALAVLNNYLGSQLEAKDRWALALTGLLGDDRIVPVLTRRIAEWAEAARGKLAEYAVRTLALLASDAALLAVDAMAIRYRTRFKNIGKAASQAFTAAADARGLSPAELGDRVLPWLGFEPGKPRVLEFGSSRFEVSIGLDFKLAWRDLVKSKAVKSLPAGAPDELKAEMKELSAGLKESARAQLLRMENLMVQQHRWPAGRWLELFLQHPLLFPFAARLVWGWFGPDGKLVATFRALEDRSLTDASDETFALSASGTVGIVHPLELKAEQRQTWLKHLADYDVVPQFAQLERPVVPLKPGQENTRVSNEFAETELNAMTFKGRAERLGWSRGSVVDAGCVNYYFKQFPGAGVDVFIALQGMYVGIDMYSNITLGQVMFVKHRSVQVASYTYDEPSGEKDERIVPFGGVPAVAFSEAMGDLVKISGKSEPQPSEAKDA
jgi:hypothetical protein